MESDKTWRWCLLLSFIFNLSIMVGVGYVMSQQPKATREIPIVLSLYKPDVTVKTQKVKQSPQPPTIKPSFSRYRHKMIGSASGGSKGSNSKPKLVLSADDISAPDTSSIYSAPVVNKIQEIVKQVQITAPTSPIEVPEVDDTFSDADVSTSPNQGEVASAGTGGSGSGLNGVGGSNGDGQGKGSGRGSGDGVGDGNGQGAGKAKGSGNGDGTYVSGGNGLPYGFRDGQGNEEPKKTVYIIDRSPSMASKIKSASSEIQGALSRLVHEDMFDLMLFDVNYSIYKPCLSNADTDVVDGAKQFMNVQISRKGGTNIEKALSAALRIDDVKDIVIVTDGMPTQGETGPHILAQKIKERNTNHVKIYVVGLMCSKEDSKDEIEEATNLLQMLASRNYGECRIIDTTPNW